MAATEQEDLDALRRRLYRPDASEEDRRRYDELLGRAEAARPRDRAPLAEAAPAPDPAVDVPPPDVPPPDVPPPDVPAAGDPVRPRWSPLRASVLVIGLLAVLALGAVLALPPTASPSAAPTSPPPTAAAASPHPDPSQATPVAVSVEGIATTAQRFHGVGPAVVPLITGSAPPDGGRLVVVLASDASAPLGWTAARWASIGSGPSTPQVIASSPRQARTGFGRPEATEYGGDPPADVEVSDPGSHAWTLTVVILDPDD